MKPEIIEVFCSKDGVRKHLGAPFRLNGWEYATDGHIAVRFPTTEPNTEGAPDVEKPWVGVDSVSQWCRADIRGIEFPSISEGRVCLSCKGEGSHTCSKCDDEHECGKCGGEGRIGRVTRENSRIYGKLGENYVSLWHIRDILSLFPDAEFSASDSNLKAIPWRAEGVEGVIMPVRYTPEAQEYHPITAASE